MAKPPDAFLIEAATILAGFDAGGEALLHQDAAILVQDGLIAKIGPLAEMRRGHEPPHPVFLRRYASVDVQHPR